MSKSSPGIIRRDGAGNRDVPFDYVAESIQERGVRFLRTYEVELPTLRETVSKMNKILKDPSQDEGDLSVDVLVQLEEKFKVPYPHEENFDQALFHALLECFDGCRPMSDKLTQKGSYSKKSELDWFIPYIPKDDDRFAWGFCRRLQKTSIRLPLNWGGSRERQYNHCSVVFKRVDPNNWAVVEVTGCVELKMEDLSTKIERDACSKGKVVSRVTLAYARCIGQPLLYTLVNVWTCLARMGIRPERDERHSPDFKSRQYYPVPFTVIAARKGDPTQNTTDGSTCGTKRNLEGGPKPGPSNASIVFAELLAPTISGKKFQYIIRHFRTFSDLESVDSQMKAYMYQLFWGGSIAHQYCAKRNSGEYLNPLPLSGDATIFGHSTLKLLCSALPKTSVRKDDEADSVNSQSNTKIRIVSSGIPSVLSRVPPGEHSSQGDLFKGKLTFEQIKELVANDEDEDEAWVFTPNFDGSVNVIVKVSTRAVHPQLVHPDKLDKAASKLQKYLQKLQSNGREESFMLSDILVGIKATDFVTITVTKDLQEATVMKALKKDELVEKMRTWISLPKIKDLKDNESYSDNAESGVAELPEEDVGLEPGFHSSQGDLFKGHLSSEQIGQILGKSALIFLEEFAGNVIVKVSTRAVHPQIVHPLKLKDAARDLFFHQRVHPEESFMLSDILVGIKSTDFVTITVTKDLQEATVMRDSQEVKCEYTALRPSQAKNMLALWQGFRTLVTTVLLELAEKTQIVHSDIRPGYDVTMNILCQHNEQENTYKLMIIDLESLMAHAGGLPEVDEDNRYLHSEKGLIIKSAVSYVFWQVLFVAHTWLMRIDHFNLDVEKFMEDLGLERLSGYEKRTPEDVTTLLDNVEELLSGEDFDLEVLKKDELVEKMKEWITFE